MNRGSINNPAFRPPSFGGRDEAFWLSGRTAAGRHEYFDPAPGYFESVGQQTAMIFDSIEQTLQASGLSMQDVTSVTEYVPMSSLRHYSEIEDARTGALSGREVPVRTKIVHTLLHDSARVEIEVSARKGSVISKGLTTRWHRSTVSDTDEVVTLPTLLPIDAEGRIIAAGDVRGQYRYCLERAEEILESIGLSLHNVVRTLDYTLPSTTDDYPHDVRMEMLGPVYPGCFSIQNDELHVPGILVALDLIASRLPTVAVNPGWPRYSGLSYSPAVRAGRRLFMSGIVSMDQKKSWPMYYGNPVAQIELVYENIVTILDAAGGTPNDLTKVNEYLTPDAIEHYPRMAAARQTYLGTAAPALTTVVSSKSQWPVFMVESIPTAIITGESVPT